MLYDMIPTGDGNYISSNSIIRSLIENTNMYIMQESITMYNKKTDILCESMDDIKQKIGKIIDVFIQWVKNIWNRIKDMFLKIYKMLRKQFNKTQDFENEDFVNIDIPLDNLYTFDGLKDINNTMNRINIFNEDRDIKNILNIIDPYKVTKMRLTDDFIKLNESIRTFKEEEKNIYHRIENKIADYSEDFNNGNFNDNFSLYLLGKKHNGMFNYNDFKKEEEKHKTLLDDLEKIYKKTEKIMKDHIIDINKYKSMFLNKNSLNSQITSNIIAAVILYTSIKEKQINIYKRMYLSCLQVGLEYSNQITKISIIISKNNMNDIKKDMDNIGQSVKNTYYERDMERYVQREDIHKLREVLANEFNFSYFSIKKFMNTIKYIKNKKGLDIMEEYDNKPLISKQKRSFTKNDLKRSTKELTNNFCTERINDCMFIYKRVK